MIFRPQLLTNYIQKLSILWLFLFLSLSGHDSLSEPNLRNLAEYSHELEQADPDQILYHLWSTIYPSKNTPLHENGMDPGSLKIPLSIQNKLSGMRIGNVRLLYPPKTLAEFLKVIEIIHNTISNSNGIGSVRIIAPNAGINVLISTTVVGQGKRGIVYQLLENSNGSTSSEAHLPSPNSPSIPMVIKIARPDIMGVLRLIQEAAVAEAIDNINATLANSEKIPTPKNIFFDQMGIMLIKERVGAKNLAEYLIEKEVLIQEQNTSDATKMKISIDYNKLKNLDTDNLRWIQESIEILVKAVKKFPFIATDIKPPNIFISENDQGKITGVYWGDLGLSYEKAKVYREMSDSTLSTYLEVSLDKIAEFISLGHIKIPLRKPKTVPAENVHETGYLTSDQDTRLSNLKSMSSTHRQKNSCKFILP